MGKKLLGDQLSEQDLIFINMSKIDVAAIKYMDSNKCTNSHHSLFTYKAERFPQTDTDIARCTAKRSPPDILMNIIRVLNNKLKGNEYDLWNKLCE